MPILGAFNAFNATHRGGKEVTEKEASRADTGEDGTMRRACEDEGMNRLGGGASAGAERSWVKMLQFAAEIARSYCISGLENIPEPANAYKTLPNNQWRCLIRSIRSAEATPSPVHLLRLQEALCVLHAADETKKVKKRELNWERLTIETHIEAVSRLAVDASVGEYSGRRESSVSRIWVLAPFKTGVSTLSPQHLGASRSASSASNTGSIGMVSLAMGGQGNRGKKH
ncbi:hypothetical protein C8R45DRAFT_924424 [Mycena sanguinolenta]|nr:hypothetical protein C8R45DRAFT_924424 [Mycena sanguinolenta]